LEPSQVSVPNMQFYTVSAPCQLMCTVILVKGCKPKNLHFTRENLQVLFPQGAKPKDSQMAGGEKPFNPNMVDLIIVLNNPLGLIC